MRRPNQQPIEIDVHVHPDPTVPRLLHHILERLSHMATQADIDALTVALNDAVTSIQAEADQLGTALQQIQDEITALGTANPTVDLTGLQAAVDGVSTATVNLQAAADAVEAIPPVPPVV